MREIGRVAVEALIVSLVGIALGLGVNAVNRNRLALSYVPPKLVTDTKPAPTTTTSTMPASDIEELLKAQGLRSIPDTELWAIYNDPLHASGLYIFVDAREDEPYQAGHIPGAYQLDHYHIDNYINDVLPAVLAAQKTIVYCNGGNCDDSISSAIALIQRGADKGMVYVDTGGFTEWCRQRRPVEKGARGSGDIAPGVPHE